VQGRFINPDDFLNDTHTGDPSSWNLYTYVRNNPLKYIDPDGEEVYGTDLDSKQRQQLIDDWKQKTGYQDISFNKAGKLEINVNAGFSGGSAKAREQLLDAATSTTSRFNLESVSSTEVAFANVGPGQTIQDSKGKKIRTNYTVSIDFGDFKQISGDKQAKEAFSVGLVTIHEFDHRLYNISDDPNSGNDPGPLERQYVNPIRSELKLPQRLHYSSEPVPGGIKNFFPSGGHQIRFQLNGKEKVIRWRDDVVGGQVK
jgi:hypothetical protein